MKYRLSEIAIRIEGQLTGDGNIEISGIKGIDAVKPGELTYADNDRHLKEAEESQCAGIICGMKTESCGKPFIKVKNPKFAFAQILELFKTEPVKPIGIHKAAVIDETANIGKNAYIGANAVIEKNVKIGENAVIYPNVYIGENTEIGDNVKIYPNVTVYYNCKIGNNVIIHGNVVIGSDGFGYALTAKGHYKVPQTGNVEIGNNVEIGAHTSIDRATTNSTFIGNGVKIDNQVHIAHNVQVGDNSLIIAHSGIAGSSVIGKNCVIAGHCGVRDHITIGDNSVVVGMSGVTKSIKPNSIVSGFPAKPHTEEKKLIAAYSRMPETIKLIQSMQQALLRLQRRLEKLEGQK
ncbi:UDP-3-O-(3-hydroxymyristoyl)glucosamine N-acyltransferase [Candidatus Dependentiae bacterium]|nr:UDP-3-O-(3-hydroxymyristoyl)glucosamine N-acyltransferase [Candidatus Dependentiae bacterium]